MPSLQYFAGSSLNYKFSTLATTEIRTPSASLRQRSRRRSPGIEEGMRLAPPRGASHGASYIVLAETWDSNTVPNISDDIYLVICLVSHKSP